MHSFLSITVALALWLTPALLADTAQAPPELRGLGTPASVPSGGIALEGSIPTVWPENQAVMVIFFSTHTPATTINPEYLRDFDASNTGAQIFAVSPEPPDVIRKRLSLPETAGETANDGIVILSDSKGLWKKMILAPTGRTQLPSAVAIDRSQKISWHGPGTKENFGPSFAMHSGNTWDRDAYQKNIEKAYLRSQNRNRIAKIRIQARADGKAEKALAQFDEVLESDPTNPDLMVERFKCLLVDLKRPDLAYAYGRSLAKNRPQDYITLNAMSWCVVSNPQVTRPDLEFAQEMSERANGIQRYANYTLIDTLARIYWMRGDRERAIDWQRKAVAVAPDSWHGDACRENLSTYVSGEIPPGTLPAPYRSPRRP